MAKAGRWLAAEHPEITEPGQWTRPDLRGLGRRGRPDARRRLHPAPRPASAGRVGAPIAPRTKAHILTASRTFFRDCQEWEWIARRFDPARALAAAAQRRRAASAPTRGSSPTTSGPSCSGPGSTDRPTTCPAPRPGSYYPLALVRALALTWLFSGLRSDEIARLRVGCIRWQHDGRPVAGDSTDVLVRDAVCLLDVPVHKTGTAFTKPVDPLVGQAIEAWQALRPDAAHTARPQDRRAGATCCSPSARTRSRRTTSTARSSRRSAPRPASRPPTSAATSPATGPARPSPASSTTPRSR